MAPIRRAAALAALAAFLLASAAPAARAAPAAAAALELEAETPTPAAYASQARAAAAKAARTLALGPNADPSDMSAARTAGEALAHDQAREAAAAKAARGPMHSGGTRSALAAMARSDASEAAAVACAQEWGQCGREQERGELLTVSCELGDEDAFCYEGYLADGLKVDGDAGDDVAIFRCRRDRALSSAASVCAAPSASWTRTSSGGIGHAVGATTFSAASRASTEAVEALRVANAITAQAAELRAGVLDAARMGELSVPLGGFGEQFAAMLGAEEGTLLPGDGAVFDFA